MESDEKPYNGVEQAELRCWGDKEKIWKSRKGGNNSGSMTITSPPLVGPQFPSHVPAKSGRHRFNPGPARPRGSRAPPQSPRARSITGLCFVRLLSPSLYGNLTMICAPYPV